MYCTLNPDLTCYVMLCYVMLRRLTRFVGVLVDGAGAAARGSHVVVIAPERRVDNIGARGTLVPVFTACTGNGGEF